MEYTYGYTLGRVKRSVFAVHYGYKNTVKHPCINMEGDAPLDFFPVNLFGYYLLLAFL